MRTGSYTPFWSILSSAPVRLVCQVATFCLLAGCGQGRLLRVEVAAELAVPQELSRMAIEITASRTESGQFCQPARREFELQSGTELPIRVDVSVGQVYTAWAAIRVTGWQADPDPVIQLVQVTPLPTDEDWSVTLNLEHSCLGQLCPSGQTCRAGGCVDLPLPGVFDDPSLIDDQPCDAASR